MLYYLNDAGRCHVILDAIILIHDGAAITCWGEETAHSDSMTVRLSVLRTENFQVHQSRIESMKLLIFWQLFELYC